MGCNEVDARVKPSAVTFIEIGASGKSIRHVTNTPFIALPKTADRVAKFSVPFRPGRGKVAHLIAAFPDVPRFCDQLHLREHRVLLDYLEKWMQRIESRMIARELRCEIESKSVHVHLLYPVSQAVGHQLQRPRVNQIQAVTCAAEIEIEPRILRVQPVVGEVIDSAKTERWAKMISFCGMIINDVQNHFDAS